MSTIEAHLILADVFGQRVARAGPLRVEYGICRSTDTGATWTQTYSGIEEGNERYISSFAFSGMTCFAGTMRGVFRSTDNGTTWNRVDVGLRNTDIRVLAVAGTELYAGMYAGVFRSVNNGTLWTEVDTGLPVAEKILSLAVYGNDLYAGTWGGGVWHRALSDMTTRVNDGNGSVPTHAALAQNYPNPFNPSTTITFSLPSQSFVTLKIIDVMGREVASLVSQEMAAGTYSRQWNASGMPSGVYFYRLQAGRYAETKRLVILK